jgi:hypothetical protein
MEYSNESYSPNLSSCRKIPIGATTAEMLGSNSPQAFPAGMDNYTLEWWMKFDSDAHATSTGISPEIFSAHSATEGISVSLEGIAGPGAHQWLLRVEHVVLGVTNTYYIAGFVIDASRPWELYQLVYDFGAGVGDQLKLYINGVQVGAEAGAVVSPGRPSTSCPISYGSADLVGEIDSIRMLSSSLSGALLLDSYLERTTLPPPETYEWRMEILVDGATVIDRVIPEDETERSFADFSAPVRSFVGVHAVAIRLKYAKV